MKYKVIPTNKFKKNINLLSKEGKRLKNFMKLLNSW